jgi:hypothetical protein
MDEQSREFNDRFESLSTFDILIKLRARDDAKFKVDFHVDFSQIELVAKDVRNTYECNIIDIA